MKIVTSPKKSEVKFNLANKRCSRSKRLHYLSALRDSLRQQLPRANCKDLSQLMMGHSASVLLKQPPRYEASLLYFNVNDQTLGSLPSAVRYAVDRTTKRLIVVLASSDFDSAQHDSLVSKWDSIQKLLVLAYVPAARTAQARNDPLFSTDVILVPSSRKAAEQLSEETWDAVLTLDGGMTHITHSIW